MLEEESRHGYQIIKDLEERFKGFYSPSPCSIYPYYKCWKIETLYRFLKKVTKIYTITDEGKTF